MNRSTLRTILVIIEMVAFAVFCNELAKADDMRSYLRNREWVYNGPYGAEKFQIGQTGNTFQLGDMFENAEATTVMMWDDFAFTFVYTHENYEKTREKLVSEFGKRSIFVDDYEVVTGGFREQLARDGMAYSVTNLGNEVIFELITFMLMTPDRKVEVISFLTTKREWKRMLQPKTF